MKFVLIAPMSKENLEFLSNYLFLDVSISESLHTEFTASAPVLISSEVIAAVLGEGWWKDGDCAVISR